VWFTPQLADFFLAAVFLAAVFFGSSFSPRAD
jgi:hypothetical protein